ncbi:MAG: tyrosine-type recombinase/integrase [Rhodobacteraceae bacterium]|nr:tyrosine-type recombinase/integrase [Paracoccaceae bacterium]
MRKPKGERPPFVHVYRDRHGKERIYLKKPGLPNASLPGPLLSKKFWAAYKKAIKGEGLLGVEPTFMSRNTISGLVEAYFRSPNYKNLAESTRRTYRAQFEKFREAYGDNPVVGFRRRHAKRILEDMADRPEAANSLLKRLKVLMAYAVEMELIESNPLVGLRGFKSRGEGFHTWTEDEIAAFETHHRIGSKARLAMTLMLCTGQRRSDAVRMGWQHVNGNLIFVRQQKTNTSLQIPLHPDLEAVLAHTPKTNLTFLLTEYGKPFSPAGFGNWMRKMCDAAGLPACTSHGLRKACARRLAEAGCSNQEIKAITGHATEAEVARYTKAADQVQMAQNAIARMNNARDQLNSANHSAKVSRLKQ